MFRFYVPYSVYNEDTVVEEYSQVKKSLELLELMPNEFLIYDGSN